MKSKESVPKLTIQEYEELLKRANKCIGIMQDALQKIGFEFEGRIVEIVHKAETEAMEALFLKDQTEGNDCSSETPLKSQDDAPLSNKDFNHKYEENPLFKASPSPIPPSLPSILQEEKEGNTLQDIVDLKGIGELKGPSPPISSSLDLNHEPK